MAKRKYKRLHYEDRQTIEAMSKQGSSVKDIAAALGTHRDTIYREFKRWRKTPYQITTLFKYHKEYNPHIFRQEQAGTPAATENMDDIDIALGGF